MAAFLSLLADENVPKQAILALRNLGLDIAWVQEIAPGLKNGDVFDLARKQNRLQKEISWEGHYSVVAEGTIRSVPLPKRQVERETKS